MWVRLYPLACCAHSQAAGWLIVLCGLMGTGKTPAARAYPAKGLAIRVGKGG